MADKVKAADLENGNVLMLLKSKFTENPSEETLLPLLSCLRDSVVKVPFVAEMSEADKKRYRECKEGENFKNQDEVKLTADILKGADGLMYFPVFSQDEQLPEDYKSKFTIIPVTMIDVLKMAHSDSNVKGIVLDGFTEAFVLTFELADYMVQIPSRIGDE